MTRLRVSCDIKLYLQILKRQCNLFWKEVRDLKLVEAIEASVGYVINYMLYISMPKLFEFKVSLNERT